MSSMTRTVTLAFVLLAATWAPPSTAELLFHQGFETCWVPGKTEAQFLEAIRTSIDGTSSCIPETSGIQSGFAYTVCGAANGCGASIAGCPVSISAAPFTGDFLTGQFTGPGTAANITVPLQVTGFGNCTVNLNNTTLAFTLDYLMQADGIDGVYSAEMMPPTVEITNYSLVNNNCSSVLFALISSNIGSAVSAAEADAAAAIEPDLRATTLDQSICPLTAP